MDLPADAYHFLAPVLRHEEGFRFHYLPLPADIADALQAEGVRRLVGTMNGRAVSRAIHGRRDGERFLILGQDLLRTIGAALGDPVAVALRPDPHPDRVDLPEELAIALEQDPEAAARFYAFTPGRQRSIASYVEGAKRVETRITRALALAHKLRTHTLYGDLQGRADEAEG